MNCHPHDFHWSYREAKSGFECAKCGRFIRDLAVYKYLNERYDRYQLGPRIQVSAADPPTHFTVDILVDPAGEHKETG